jgi:hypothetical protein
MATLQRHINSRGPTLPQQLTASTPSSGSSCNGHPPRAINSFRYRFGACQFIAFRFVALSVHRATLPNDSGDTALPHHCILVAPAHPALPHYYREILPTAAQRLPRPRPRPRNSAESSSSLACDRRRILSATDIFPIPLWASTIALTSEASAPSTFWPLALLAARRLDLRKAEAGAAALADDAAGPPGATPAA